MTLELNKVAAQIDAMGQELAERAQRFEKALPALRELRRLFSAELDWLRDLAAAPAGREAGCASPTDEPLNLTYPAPEPPVSATIIAADGSQILPDPHGWVLYYLINVGTLVYHHGRNRAPQPSTDSKVGYGADQTGNLPAVEIGRVDAETILGTGEHFALLGKVGGAVTENVLPKET